MSDHADPFYERWARRQHPPLTSSRRASARVEHAALHDELAAIDAELEVLCARRRAALDRLGALRGDLWPLDQRCHRRRQSRVDEIPMPPAPHGAEALGGAELRATCLGILRRQGPCALRELHGLLHRHGYRIEGERAVQSLADAMAYEVRQGRAHRVARGVYGAVADGAERPHAEPLPWEDPDEDRPQLDPVVLDDPERWSTGTWPAPPDRPGSQIRPPDRYDVSTLDDDVRLARARAAALPRRHPHAEAHDASHWQRFVDESVPMVQNWAARRRRWAERNEERGRRRAQDGGDAHLWGDDPPSDGP